jgi:flagellar biosynthetic protein FliR
VKEMPVLDIYSFMLVLVRTSGLVMTIPIIGGANVPARVRVGLAVALSLVMKPIIRTDGIPTDLLPFILVVFKELLVGITIGYMVSLAFATIQMAGSISDYQMGFGIVDIIDPSLYFSTPLVGRLYILIASMLFFGLDGHHIVIWALKRSFETIPIGGMVLKDPLLSSISGAISNGLLISFAMAAPIVAVTFLSDLILGIVVRAVPYVNAFIMGFPLKIGIGLITLILVLGAIIGRISGIFGDGLTSELSRIIRAMGG